MTSLDTSLVIAASDPADPNHSSAVDLLTQIGSVEALVVSPVVFAELMASSRREKNKLFLEEAGIDVKLEMPSDVWESAGIDFGSYCRARKDASQRERILPDFLIAAQAAYFEWNVATLDRKFFREGFKGLAVRRK